MSTSTIDKIKEIQLRAELEIKELRQQAVSEIAGNLATAREEVRTLEAQYAQLTGKPVPGEVGEQVNGQSSRKRLTSDEKAVLVETVRGILASKPEGAKMGDLVSLAGHKVAAVREALARIPTKTTGAKITTRYFLK